MGDITIYLLVESSLLGNNKNNAAEQILSSSSSSTSLFQFASTSHTIPADTSLIELMNDHVLPNIIKHSSSSEADQQIAISNNNHTNTNFLVQNNITVLDISYHPAKIITNTVRQYNQHTVPSSKHYKVWDGIPLVN